MLFKSKKEKDTNILSGKNSKDTLNQKKNPNETKRINSSNKPIENKKDNTSSAGSVKASIEAKKPLKEVSKVNAQAYVVGKPIRESFDDFSKIPRNAKVLSTNKESPFYIEGDDLRNHIIVLEAIYAPLSMGNEIPCIILILTNSKKSRINISEMTRIAKEQNKYFVADVKINASQFIQEFRRDLESRNEGKDLKEETGNRKRIVELFEDVLIAGASDLHIEVSEKTIIRCRINGEIKEFKEHRGGAILNKETGFEFARTIYNSYGAVSGKSFNPKITQDASGLIENVNGTDLRIRIATAPTAPDGFDMVMRILIVQDSAKPLTLEQLGYEKKQIAMIVEAIAQGAGVTIIAGTTGSGKSTTLQNIIMGEINNRNGTLKVITVEDPPEYYIPGASQIPVVRDANGDARSAFKNAIKASLRMDPDVIMIGEVRDEQSAELLIEAVQTGHKVLSTIHAGSAIAVLFRLQKLGIDRDTLSDKDFISGLIYQKLFPVLCPHCSLALSDGHIPIKNPIEKVLVQNHFVSEDLLLKVKNKHGKLNIVRALQDEGYLTLLEAEKALEIFKSVNSEAENEKLLKRISVMAGNLSDYNIRFQGEGCEFCKKGIKGRTVVSEIVRPDMKFRELVSEGKTGAIHKYWRKNLGGKTAIEDAYEKMLAGKLSPIDVEETFGFIMPNK